MAPTAAAARPERVAFGNLPAPLNELDNEFATVATVAVPSRPTVIIAQNISLDLGLGE